MFLTNLGKYKVSGINQEEYHIIKKEVFSNNIYYFDIKNPNPLILDLGSHIGITILYFKERYPTSKIFAYEPNPHLFEYLKENVFVNNLKDVEIYSKAISNTKGTMDLNIDVSENKWYSTGGYIQGGWNGTQKTETISVESITLSSILDKKIDILKIDIEGLELKVLEEAQSKLDLVENIVVEYHPDNTNKLKKLIKLLSKYFTLEIYEEGKLVKKYNEKKLLILKGTKLN